jgi:molybdate transport system ATP-binding protein
MTLDVAIRHRLGDFAIDVAFRSERPGITALFGPSGAGKTTIVQALAGLLRPQEGRIVVNGETLFDSDSGRNVKARRRRIGYVFQDARLFPHLSVRANLLFGARRRRQGRPERQLDAIVALLGIASLLGRRPGDLSGGERQRVALGRALLSEPQLLLLDEPLAALDRNRREEILPYLERLRDESGVPMLYVSHAIDEVVRLADEMVVLDAGRVAAQGSVFDITARPELFALTGRLDAGAVIEARIDAQDAVDRLTVLAFDDGRLWVPSIDAAVGTPVRIRIRARDIMLALDEPQRISANNVVTATVAGIHPEPDGSVDVLLACGASRLIARITRRSLHRLALQPGMAVHAVIKSVTIDRRTLPGAGETDAAN